MINPNKPVSENVSAIFLAIIFVSVMALIFTLSSINHNIETVVNQQNNESSGWVKTENGFEVPQGNTLIKNKIKTSEISSLAAEVRKDQNQDCMDYLETLKGYAQDDLTISECRIKGRIFMDAVRDYSASHPLELMKK